MDKIEIGSKQWFELTEEQQLELLKTQEVGLEVGDIKEETVKAVQDLFKTALGK